MTESFVIGIIWATASISGEYLVIKNKKKEAIVPVASFFERNIYQIGEQSIIKMRLSHPIIARLHGLSWHGRKDLGRSIPHGEINIEEWARGYCSIRAHICKNKKRLRIRGSQNIIEALSYNILPNIGLAPKKPQRRSSIDGETWEISYQTAEQVSIFSEWRIN